MWATVLRLFGRLASLDGPLITNLLFLSLPGTSTSSTLVRCLSRRLLLSRQERRSRRWTHLALWGGLGGPRKASKSLIDNLGVPLDQERPPKWKNHPAEEWVLCISVVLNASTSSVYPHLWAFCSYSCSWMRLSLLVILIFGWLPHRCPFPELEPAHPAYWTRHTETINCQPTNYSSTRFVAANNRAWQLSDHITVTAKYKARHNNWCPPNIRDLWNKPRRLDGNKSVDSSEIGST
jgi:hypothetical protein